MFSKVFHGFPVVSSVAFNLFSRLFQPTKRTTLAYDAKKGNVAQNIKRIKNKQIIKTYSSSYTCLPNSMMR